MEQPDELQDDENQNDNLSDILSREPTQQEKADMRVTIKKPSEWLQLLCSKWSEENASIVAQVDKTFLNYKSYLNGQLSSQLLCRLSIFNNEAEMFTSSGGTTQSKNLDFWAILGIEDEFDRNYIVAQVEKFCLLYDVRGNNLLPGSTQANDEQPSGIVSPLENQNFSSFDTGPANLNDNIVLKKQQAEMLRAKRKAKSAEKALEMERRMSHRKQQQRIISERREQKFRQREGNNLRKAAEKAAREAAREERRKKKVEARARRELQSRQQKETALRRAADLVQSNRVPIEITRGAAAATAAANAAVAANGLVPASIEQQQLKRARSSIVVSTAGDLHQIVMHSRNLWSKYNAIAKEHNQKVNWITVAKELGIHVKVREKYARMHSRALQRGFDFESCGHYKIKEHPHIFLEPLNPSTNRKSTDSRRVSNTQSNTHEIHEDQRREIEKAAAAAAAAAMEANRIKTEELIDGSMVANQIENTDFVACDGVKDIANMQVQESTTINPNPLQCIEQSLPESASLAENIVNSNETNTLESVTVHSANGTNAITAGIVNLNDVAAPGNANSSNMAGANINIGDSSDVIVTNVNVNTAPNSIKSNDVTGENIPTENENYASSATQNDVITANLTNTSDIVGDNAMIMNIDDRTTLNVTNSSHAVRNANATITNTEDAASTTYVTVANIPNTDDEVVGNATIINVTTTEKENNAIPNNLLPMEVLSTNLKEGEKISTMTN